MFEYISDEGKCLLARYLGVEDIIALSQLTPSMRYLFSPLSFQSIYVVPESILSQLSINPLVHRVIHEHVLTKPQLYGWFRCDSVFRVILHFHIPLLSRGITRQIKMEHFSNLKNVRVDFHRYSRHHSPVYPPYIKHHNEIIKKNNTYKFEKKIETKFDDQKKITGDEGCEFIYEITSTQFENYQQFKMDAMFVKGYQFCCVKDYSLLSSLQLCFRLEPLGFNKRLIRSLTIDGLSQCVNLKKLYILTNAVNSLDTPILSVIRNYLPRLETFKFFTPSFSQKKKFKKMNSLFPLIKVRRLDMVYGLAMCHHQDIKSELHKGKGLFQLYDIVQNESKVMKFCSLESLEIYGNSITGNRDVPGIVDIEKESNFFYRCRFPKLKELRISLVFVDNYFNSLLLPMTQSLFSIDIALYSGADRLWVLKHLHLYVNLKKLALRQYHNSTEISVDEKTGRYRYRAYDEMRERYSSICPAINKALAAITNGNIDIRDIEGMSRRKVLRLIKAALHPGNVKHNQSLHPNVRQKHLVKLLQDPSHLGIWYGEQIRGLDRKFNKKYTSHSCILNPPFNKKYISVFLYSFDEAVYDICFNSLKQLQVLKLQGVQQAFQSPRFDRLINLHPSLKLVNLTYAPYAQITNLDKTSFVNYVTKKAVPLLQPQLAPAIKVIDSLYYEYCVEVEGLRKNYSKDIYRADSLEDVDYSIATEYSEFEKGANKDIREQYVANYYGYSPYLYSEESCSFQTSLSSNILKKKQICKQLKFL